MNGQNQAHLNRLSWQDLMAQQRAFSLLAQQDSIVNQPDDIRSLLKQRSGFTNYENQMNQLLLQFRHYDQQQQQADQQRSGIINYENQTDQQLLQLRKQQKLILKQQAAQQRSEITNYENQTKRQLLQLRKQQKLVFKQQEASLAQQRSAIAQTKPQYGFISGSNDNLSDYQALLAYQQQILSTRIRLSNKNLRLIIGKNGETIKHIQTIIGVKTEIIKDIDADLNSQCRSLELTGNLMQIDSAEKLMMDVLGVAESGGEYFFVQVPDKKVACVCSAVGNVRIEIYPWQYDHTARSLWISGRQEHVESAKQLVPRILSRNCPGDWNCRCKEEVHVSDLHNKFGALGLKDGGLDSPDRMFVCDLPYKFSEVQIRELLESFGVLREFVVVKDGDTRDSKGYVYCVYQDVSVTDIACAALNGFKMGDKTLTVRRTNKGTIQPMQDQEAKCDQME